VPAAGDDVLERGLDGAPHAEQVDLDDALEHGRRHGARGRRRVGGDAGVGEDDVQPAEALDGGADDVVHGRRVGDVRGDGEHLPGRQERGGAVEAGAAEVGEDDVRAAAGERRGDGGADAAGAAGDQRGLAGQGECHGHGDVWVGRCVETVGVSGHRVGRPGRWRA
jgi:hypothetical protein